MKKRVFTEEQKETIKKLRALEFPKTKNLDFDRQLYGNNLCNITNEQLAKLQKLWFNVYGQRKNGYNHSHHSFLQGIVEHKEMSYFSGHKKLSDECLIDVYDIAPELFDVEKIEAFYKKNKTLIKKIESKIKIKKLKSDTELLNYSFEYLENNKTIKTGNFIYNESTFEVSFDDKNFETLDSLNVDKYFLMEMVDTNKRIESLGIRTVNA